MKLPNGEQAIVEDGKLLDYVLSPTHPICRHHAALFARVLGVTQQNHEILKRELLRAAASSETVTSGKASPYGRKYEMRLTIEGPRGHAKVLAVWLVEHGEKWPRLITCYLE